MVEFPIEFVRALGGENHPHAFWGRCYVDRQMYVRRVKMEAAISDPVIIDAIRTPIGAQGGSLTPVRPDDMAALVLRALVDPRAINQAGVEAMCPGCANQAGEDNRNVVRMAALLAGFPVDVPAVTFNRLGAYSLNAISQAARSFCAAPFLWPPYSVRGVGQGETTVIEWMD